MIKARRCISVLLTFHIHYNYARKSFVMKKANELSFIDYVRQTQMAGFLTSSQRPS